MLTRLPHPARSIALAALVSLVSTSALAAPTLKPSVRVAAAIVTVGDLVDDSGPFAALPLYRAPDLGTTGSVAASDILARVKALGLADVKSGGLADVVVTRLATEVTAADLARQLAASVAQRLGVAPEQIEISFDQTPTVAKADSAASNPARLVDISFSPSSGRFDAVVENQQGRPGRAAAAARPGDRNGRCADAHPPPAAWRRGAGIRPQAPSACHAPRPTASARSTRRR